MIKSNKISTLFHHVLSLFNKVIRHLVNFCILCHLQHSCWLPHLWNDLFQLKNPWKHYWKLLLLLEKYFHHSNFHGFAFLFFYFNFAFGVSLPFIDGRECFYGSNIKQYLQLIHFVNFFVWLSDFKVAKIIIIKKVAVWLILSSYIYINIIFNIQDSITNLICCIVWLQCVHWSWLDGGLWIFTNYFAWANYSYSVATATISFFCDLNNPISTLDIFH